MSSIFKFLLIGLICFSAYEVFGVDGAKQVMAKTVDNIKLGAADAVHMFSGKQ